MLLDPNFILLAYNHNIYEKNGENILQIAPLYSIFTKIHGKAPCTPYNSPKALPHCELQSKSYIIINIATCLSVRLSLISGWWTDIAVTQTSLKLAGMIKEDKTYSAPYTDQCHIQGQDVTYLDSNKHF